MDFQKIRLIVYDFDGVMTDNKVYISQDGVESVVAHRGDGHAVSEIRKLGIEQIILSTEVNPVVRHRANKLKIEVIHGVQDKKTVLAGYLKEKGIDPENVLYIGNDLNDYDCMLSVGMRGCPQDAEPEIIRISHWVSKKAGGNGVIRELLREISGGEANGL